MGKNPIKNTKVVDGKEKIGLQEKLTEKFQAIIARAEAEAAAAAAVVSIQLFMLFTAK